MNSLCEFPPSLQKGDKCVKCGRVLRRAYESPPRAFCKLQCKHIGRYAGAVKVECETCRGDVMVNVPANECGAFGPLGRCLPTYSPADRAKWHARKPESDIYHLCRGCDRFEALPPATNNPIGDL